MEGAEQGDEDVTGGGHGALQAVEGSWEAVGKLEAVEQLRSGWAIGA